MSEQIKQDIDLIEILFYLKKKIRIILFIIAICMAMVLLFLYNREIKLEWSGDKRDLPTAEAEISRVQASIIKWYASEYHNGRQVLDEIQTPSAINSELYTKMIYLTRNWSLYPNGDGCVTISSPEIKNKYPAAICLALGFFISIVISVMFCLVKKMVDEYQQNSGQ